MITITVTLTDREAEILRRANCTRVEVLKGGKPFIDLPSALEMIDEEIELLETLTRRLS